METQAQLAEYHYISMATLHRLRRKGIAIHDHLAIEDAIMRQHKRPESWINGNPNHADVRFPSSSKLPERNYLACYCQGKDFDCVSCRADWDYGCKYAVRKIEAGEW